MLIIWQSEIDFHEVWAHTESNRLTNKPMYLYIFVLISAVLFLVGSHHKLYYNISRASEKLLVAGSVHQVMDLCAFLVMQKFGEILSNSKKYAH